MSKCDLCRRIETCSAPLCPKNEASLAAGLWYPGEPICELRELGANAMIKAQKKIARIGADPARYFKAEMIARLSVVRRGVKGLDPDRDERPQLASWLRNHPLRVRPRRPPSEKQILIRELFRNRHISHQKAAESSA